MIGLRSFSYPTRSKPNVNNVDQWSAAVDRKMGTTGDNMRKFLLERYAIFSVPLQLFRRDKFDGGINYLMKII